MVRIRRLRSTSSSANSTGNTHTDNAARSSSEPSDFVSAYTSTADKKQTTDESSATRNTSSAILQSLTNPLWCYHGFRVAVLALTFFGVIMVFSSSVVSLVSSGSSPWKQALSQGIYCVLGLFLAFITTHVSVTIYRRFGFVVVLAAMILQALTLTPLGIEVNGNKGWIGVDGVFTMQPAEVMKLALCIWLPSAMIVARKRYNKEGMKAYVLPIIIYIACLGLVMLGKDMGTGIIIVIIGIVAFFVGGFPVKWLVTGIAVIAVLGAIFIIASPNRLSRILAAYQSCEDTEGICYQAIHARYAIASGGLFGVGIGNSREKWDYLPAAHNDFIFAIIGEETGFIGATLVILLFAVIGWCLVVMAMQSRDRYASIVMITIAVWIVGQGLINVAVVVGLLPIIGVPMPYVSAGGSSMIMCLAAAGVASAMMRGQPQIKAESART